MTKHEQKIKSMLYDLGITPEIMGYHYLASAIAIKEKANKTKDFSIKLYHETAEKFNTTPSAVERAIRHAIDRSFNNKTPLFLTIFEPVLNINKRNITNSCFIAMTAEHIASQETED